MCRWEGSNYVQLGLWYRTIDRVRMRHVLHGNARGRGLLAEGEGQVTQSELEAEFELQLRAAGIDGYVRELLFHPTRKWRFDFAWPEQLLAVEIDGFGHHKLSRYTGDVEKFNEATLAGWRVLHVTRAMLDDLSGIGLVAQALRNTEERQA